MRSTMPSEISKSLSPLCVVSVGDAALLPPLQPEEPSLEQAPLLEMPQLPQTPALDLVLPSWPRAAVGTYPSSR